MIQFNNLLDRLKESSGVLESFKYQGDSVVINKDFQIVINGEHVADAEDLKEAKEYTYKYINLKNQAEVKTYIPEHVVVRTISKHHSVKKVTDKLIESYNKLLESNEFTVDPVINELKSPNSFGKYEFNLKDGSRVSIDESTRQKLTSLLHNKYDIVDYMKESIDNFKRIVKEIRD